MRSITAISCALLACAVAGCDKQQDGADDGGYGAISLFDPVALNPSLCGSPAIPFPNDALYSGTTDGTLNIPNPSAAPFVTAANLTDGFATSASFFTDVLGSVDYATADEAVLVFEADASPRFLTYGVDYTLQPSIAMAQLSGSGHSTGTCTGTVPARFMPISQQRSRILIEPLKPLNPSTKYIVAVTKALKSVDGIAASTSEQFPVANSDTKICKLGSTGSDATGSEPLCSDAAATRAYASSIAPVLGLMTTATQFTTIETLRRQAIRPVVTSLKAAHAAFRGSALNDSDLLIAWSFTTQSTSVTLSRLNTGAAAAAFQVANTTLSTGDLGLGLSDTADIWAGVIQAPYYLANIGGGATAPLTTSWTSATTLNAVNHPALSSPTAPVPCAALAKSASTSICYPDPSALSTETIPVMVTVPNTNSGQSKPANGWPVAIFQHGVTRNRTDVLALAPTLAAAGFVVVSIDHPLHGITNNSANLATNPFYRNQIFANPAFGGVFNALMTGERTFDLDLVDNTPDASNACLPANSQPDTAIDSSGTHYVNLSNLAVARDNLRQSEADILHLARSMASLDLDQNSAALTAADIDETRIHFVGQSLGAIVGTTVLGVADTALIQAGSLNVPGGGLGKLLDASAAFGPRIASGLGCSGVFEGTDTYETFVRFAQHLIDPADPINYAAAANTNHPIHMIEVIGDAVVPNSAGTTCPAPSALPYGLGATATAVSAAGTAAASGAAGAALLAYCPPLVIPATSTQTAITYQDETLITGYLSGTAALARVMGLTTTKNMGSAPFTAQTPPAGPDTLVVFGPDTAEHGTLLTPHSSSVDTNDADTDPTNDADAAFLAATCAQQKQTATFFATYLLNGGTIPIGGTCP